METETVTRWMVQQFMQGLMTSGSIVAVVIERSGCIWGGATDSLLVSCFSEYYKKAPLAQVKPSLS